LASRL